MTTHIIILSHIIVIIGALAGFICFLTYYYRGIITNKKEVLWHILSGIGAAVLVPLLLNMLSSDLINYHNGFNEINYFVFAGFCFIAGYFSDRFINSIGDKILRDLEKTKRELNKAITETKDNEDKIDFLVSIETDSEEETESHHCVDLNQFKQEKNIVDKSINEKVEKVINAFYGKFRFRTIKGLVKELKYSENEIKSILEKLEIDGLAKQFALKDGKNIWAMKKDIKIKDNWS